MQQYYVNTFLKKNLAVTCLPAPIQDEVRNTDWLNLNQPVENVRLATLMTIIIITSSKENQTPKSHFIWLQL